MRRTPEEQKQACLEALREYRAKQKKQKKVRVEIDPDPLREGRELYARLFGEDASTEVENG